MKLIGSQIEHEIREGLIFSRLDSSKQNDIDPRVIVGLNDCKPNWKFAYFLEYIPDQGEDFYTILCDRKSILRIEVDRVDKSKSVQFDTLKVEEYRKGLSGKTRVLTLLIALELIGA